VSCAIDRFGEFGNDYKINLTLQVTFAIAENLCATVKEMKSKA